MCLNFMEERSQKCDRENREWRWRQLKSIYRLHPDLVVKQLCYIGYLNAWATKATNCATFRNQKVPLSESYVVVLSFYIKVMEQRTLQACSLRHNIKKVMFSVQGKLDLFKSGRRGGEFSSPYPPLATHLGSFWKRMIDSYLYLCCKSEVYISFRNSF